MRVTTAAVIGAAVLAMAGTALAGPCGGGPGGCGTGCGGAKGTPVNIDALKKFQSATTEMRNQMMIKRVELRNEQLKQPVDETKVALLTKEMNDLRTKITAAATANGLPFANDDCGICGGMGMGKGRGMMRSTADQAR